QDDIQMDHLLIVDGSEMQRAVQAAATGSRHDNSTMPPDKLLASVVENRLLVGELSDVDDLEPHFLFRTLLIRHHYSFAETQPLDNTKRPSRQGLNPLAAAVLQTKKHNVPATTYFPRR